LIEFYGLKCHGESENDRFRNGGRKNGTQKNSPLIPRTAFLFEFPIFSLKEGVVYMWPRFVEWTALRFGVEIEFVEGNPDKVELLPGWKMAMDERQIDDSGAKSGAELQSPPLNWEDREQIQIMLQRLRNNGAVAIWSCGLHVHIGLEPWGEQIIVPFSKAVLNYQDVLRTLLQTADQRLIYCPKLTQEMHGRFMISQSESDLRHTGRPQSHRCGINLRSWYDIGTVEIRYANGTLDYEQVETTVQLALRFVSAIGAEKELPSDLHGFSTSLGVPRDGYPPPLTPPQWYRERIWLENMLLPIVQPFVDERFPSGEILEIIPGPKGIVVTGEKVSGDPFSLTFHLGQEGWTLV
jgi:hypothetical protein